MKKKEKRKPPAGSEKPKRKKHGDYSVFMVKKEKPLKKAGNRKKKAENRPAKRSKYSITSYSRGLSDELVRLNKFIANSGICSRREADKLIEAGAVTVNGVVVRELGTKISPADKVCYGDQTLKQEKLRYILLNKPRGYITTTDDPFDRKTIMQLIRKACTERVYPVGRLDRNTTGLLLLTNDGKMAKRLTHPKHEIKKLYHVFLDKALTKKDMMRIAEGMELEDGLLRVDKIAYVEGAENRREIGLELHSGRNRIVRRLFEHLGYDVVRLDRVMFAGLTKKDLPRGKWRFLTEKEVGFLKMK